MFYYISTYELYVLKPNNLKGVIRSYGLFKFFLSKVRKFSYLAVKILRADSGCLGDGRR